MVRKLESYLAEKARILQDDSDLTSRTDLRKDRIKSESHILSVAVRLCKLSDKRLTALGLGDALVELVVAARKIDSTPARDRALRRIRRELRDLDLATLERQLDALDQPTTKKSMSPEEEWLQRLVQSDSGSLDAFLREYAVVDRSQMRTLLRNLVRAKGEEAARTKKKVLALIRDAMTSHAQEPFEDGEGTDAEDSDDSEGSESSHT
ncbi:MAG: DUF615 domain-containing protein [Polyangiaceae bacterium]